MREGESEVGVSMRAMKMLSFAFAIKILYPRRKTEQYHLHRKISYLV